MARKITCSLCRDLEVDKSGRICELCFYTRFQADEVMQAYSQGDVEDEIKNFIPEIELTFERDNWYSRHFTAAMEVIIQTALFGVPSPTPISRIPSLRELDESKVTEIFEILEPAGIAHLRQNSVHLDTLADELAKRLPTGVDLSSPEVRIPLKEVRGAICMALGNSIVGLEKPVRRPRNFLLNLNCLSNILSRYEPFGGQTGPVPKEADGDEFFIPLRSRVHERFMIQIAEPQMLKILGDLLGWTKAEPKIIESFRVTPKGYYRFALKDVTLAYLERMRERWRERPRAR